MRADVRTRQRPRRVRATTLIKRLTRTGKNPEEVLRDAEAKAGEGAAGFPRLRACLDTPAAADNAAPDGTFVRGLEALLDGLAARLETA
ncbi:hypothetical protein ACIRNI_03455 [Streptomyces sp. NPDC093546]|uniref:hypothetical protein n=1 Tax=Streptomyces sp. NPDC093546 TaxID=3366040 RepID=UPI00382DB3A1